MIRSAASVALAGALISGLWAVAGLALAQPYRCTVEGRTVYQQAPCAGGQPVNISGAGQADLAAPAARQLQREVAAIERRNRVEAAVRSGHVFVGMTAEEAARSWGQPRRVNRTLTAAGSREQWVYRGGGPGRAQYVYLEDGVVTAIQSPH